MKTDSRLTIAPCLEEEALTPSRQWIDVNKTSIVSSSLKPFCVEKRKEEVLSHFSTLGLLCAAAVN